MHTDRASASATRRRSGFTLIELIITIAVIAVLATLAAPSFAEFIQRSAVRGAAEQVVDFWSNARFEAIKRNAPVKVTFSNTGDGRMCLGASVQADTTDYTPCDCFSGTSCALGRFPADQAEWRGVIWRTNPSMGNNTGVVFIDPKRGFLTRPGDAGNLTVSTRFNQWQYRLRFGIDMLGRGTVCQPADAPDKLGDYARKTCG